MPTIVDYKKKRVHFERPSVGGFVDQRGSITLTVSPVANVTPQINWAEGGNLRRGRRGGRHFGAGVQVQEAGRRMRDSRIKLYAKTVSKKIERNAVKMLRDIKWGKQRTLDEMWGPGKFLQLCAGSGDRVSEVNDSGVDGKEDGVQDSGGVVETPFNVDGDQQDLFGELDRCN